MFRFAHRIIASLRASTVDINAVASFLHKETGVWFAKLRPGKVNCLASDSSLSDWGKERLPDALERLGFQEESDNHWTDQHWEVLINDDHLVIQERKITE